MFNLRVVQAGYGDCLLVEFGTEAAPRYLLIDGGPAGVYQAHLKPELDRIRGSGGSVDLVVLSHVDEDHVVGLIDLLTDLQWQRIRGLPETITIGEVWHNTFAATLGDDIGTRFDRLMARAAPLRGLMATAENEARSIAQGEQLKQLAESLGLVPNERFGSQNLVTLDASADPIELGELRLRIVGPTAQNLARLRAGWLDWLADHEDRLLAASLEEAEEITRDADSSIPNRSSIMILVEAGGKTMLLTGDGRSDHLLLGLEQAGLLDGDGRLHVDLLKLPHHGSAANVSPEFFRAVTADRYVISADGRHGNPDDQTLRWLVEAAREQDRQIVIAATNPTGSTGRLLAEYDPLEYGYVLVDRVEEAHALTISLEEGGGNMQPEAKWTFMVYLAGDNNLSAAGEKDLGEMRAVGSTAEVNIVAEFDRIGLAHETERYLIQRDGLNERVEGLGETDCGDPQVLLDFVQWAVTEYPAERYALILWNHGGGWEPLEIDRIARSVGAVDYSEREAVDRSATNIGRALFRTTLERIFQLPSVHDRAICCDDGSGHSLDTVELGNVLAQIVDLLGQPLDLLGMDACLMSNLEVAYQARPYVSFIVASEENEPNDGWPYDRILAYLTANPGGETADLARTIVADYVQSYLDRHYSGPVTQAALDLSQVDRLSAPLDALADVLAARMDTAKYELGEALYQAKDASFWSSTLWDIARVCEELAAESSDQVTRQAALAVKAALQPEDDRFVIAEGHSGAKVEGCGGTTIYLPPRIAQRISRYYAELAFAQQRRWPAMLEAYHGA